jgi:hypothetical protein
LTSFSGIQNYNPFLVLVIGLSTFAGVWGTGTILLRCVRFQLPAPWSHVTAILLGIQTLSFAVQIVGMAGIASRPVLSAIWWALIAVVGATFMFKADIRPGISFPRCDRRALSVFAIVGVAIGIDLLIAIAPSTKEDEIYYHMLVPARIVSDSALHFYREPWEGAILPDMIFQISSAPTHAIGYPDAANVVSWAISITLLWFAWRFIRAHEKPAAWSALWVGALCVGLYPAAWQVTGGAHAMGDLAMATAVVAFCNRDFLLLTVTPTAYSAMLSVLLLSASTSKVSLLPASAAILVLSAWALLRRKDIASKRQVVLAAAAPWIVFYCPIVLWTWIQSGSPFGPILAGSFGSSIYPQDWGEQVFRATREMNRPPVTRLAKSTMMNYSLLVWLGVIGAFVATKLPKHFRLELACLFGLQCALIYWLLPFDARLLGGLHYGLVIVFGSFAVSEITNRLNSTRSIFAASTIFLIPWLGLQAYYAKQFVSVALGLEKHAFYKRHVPFYEDYIQLDRLLPRDAVILNWYFRLDGIYAPRPTYFDDADIPLGKSVVLFAPPHAYQDASETLVRYQMGAVIYENNHAVIKTFQTSRLTAAFGQLRVVKLTRVVKSTDE